ncbi:DNA repair protein RecO [Candidatus Peregrinibacteria bacterium]|nr:MAG: DNA repair protein RecO [Candidatus Peregrinibacteria bacterium]
MIKNFTGIIIKRKEWGEQDCLVSVLTDEGTRLDLVAKGAGSPRSKRRAHLELMNQVKGTVYQSSHQLYLQSVECIQSHFHLKQNFERVLQTYLLLEVIEQSLMPENGDPHLYELLEKTLLHLNQKESCHLGAEIGLVKWGEALGVLPSFRSCGNCHQHLAEKAQWNLEKQVLHCLNCAAPQGEDLPLKYCKALEYFKNASFEECHSLVFQEEEIKKLRELIPYLLRSHLERPLKSLEASSRSTQFLPNSAHKALPIQA